MEVKNLFAIVDIHGIFPGSAANDSHSPEMLFLPSVLRPSNVPSITSLFSFFIRSRGQLAPKSMAHIKRHKGRIPIPTGGSIKGTTLAYGEWGLRIKGQGVRLTAKQLTTAEEIIKRKIKVIKGAKVYLRVFPDIPVCVKVCICS